LIVSIVPVVVPRRARDDLSRESIVNQSPRVTRVDRVGARCASVRPSVCRRTATTVLRVVVRQRLALARCVVVVVGDVCGRRRRARVGR
jgi:hypothetical protein